MQQKNASRIIQQVGAIQIRKVCEALLRDSSIVSLLRRNGSLKILFVFTSQLGIYLENYWVTFGDFSPLREKRTTQNN